MSRGELALQEISRKKPCPKNRVEEHIEKAVIEFATKRPAYGQLRTSNELKKKGTSSHPVVSALSGCAMIWRPSDEFYSISFRKKIYHNLEEIQEDADKWIEEYNKKCTYSGR